MSLHRALGSWKHARIETRRKRGIAKRLLNMSLHRAVRAWFAVANDFRNERRIKRGIVSRLLNSSLARALRTWQHNLDELKFARGIVRRMISSSLYRALRSWQHNLAELRLKRGIAKRLLNMALHRALRSWNAAAGEVAYERRVRLGVANRLLNTALSRGLRSWQAYGEEVKFARGIARRLISSVQYRALRSWQHACDEIQLRRGIAKRLLNMSLHRTIKAWQHARDQIRLKRGIAKRLMNMALHRALRSWQAVAYELHTERRIKRGIVSRLLNSSLARALRSWQYARDAIKLARGIGRRLLSSSLYRALRSWQHSHAELRLKHGIAKRLLNMTLHRALRSWQAVAHELHAERRIKRGIINRLLNSALYRALQSWHCAVEDMQAFQRGVSVFHVDKRSLMRAMNTWAAIAATVRRLRVYGAVFKSTPSVRAALTTWMEFADEFGLMRRRLCVAAKTWQGDSLTSGFLLWARWSVELVRHRTFLRRLMNRALSDALNTWVEGVSSLSELKACFQRGASVFSIDAREMRRAWNSWAELAAARARMRRYAMALKMSAERRALHQWDVVASARQAKLELLTLSSRRMLGKSSEHHARGEMRRAFWVMKGEVMRAVVAAFEARFAAAADAPDDPDAEAADRRRLLRRAMTLWNGGLAARRKVLEKWQGSSRRHKLAWGLRAFLVTSSRRNAILAYKAMKRQQKQAHEAAAAKDAAAAAARRAAREVAEEAAAARARKDAAAALAAQEVARAAQEAAEEAAAAKARKAMAASLLSSSPPKALTPTRLYVRPEPEPVASPPRSRSPRLHLALPPSPAPRLLPPPRQPKFHLAMVDVPVESRAATAAAAARRLSPTDLGYTGFALSPDGKYARFGDGEDHSPSRPALVETSPPPRAAVGYGSGFDVRHLPLFTGPRKSPSSGSRGSISPMRS